MPEISVIIPNYNHAQFLTNRIESILNQTYTDFELLILDDCSSDHSKEIIEVFANIDSRITTYFNGQNSGSTFKQWEKGIKIAKGKYVWIAESDDYSENTFLEKLHKELKNNPNCAIAYCQSYKVNEQDEIISSMLEWTNELHPDRWNNKFINSGRIELQNFIIFRNTLPNASALLFRTTELLKVFPLKHNFKFNGDKYVYTKILLSNCLIYLPEHLNFYRFHSNTIRNTLAMHTKIIDTFVWLRLCKNSFFLSDEVKNYQIKLWEIPIKQQLNSNIKISIKLKIFSLVFSFNYKFALRCFLSIGYSGLLKRMNHLFKKMKYIMKHLTKMTNNSR